MNTIDTSAKKSQPRKNSPGKEFNEQQVVKKFIKVALDENDLLSKERLNQVESKYLRYNHILQERSASTDRKEMNIKSNEVYTPLSNVSNPLHGSSAQSPRHNNTTFKKQGETINVREILKDPRIIEKLHDNIRDDELDAWVGLKNNVDDSFNKFNDDRRSKLRLSSNLGAETQHEGSKDNEQSSRDKLNKESDDQTQTLKLNNPTLQVSDKLGMQIVQPSEPTLEVNALEQCLSKLKAKQELSPIMKQSPNPNTKVTISSNHSNE